MLPCNVIVQDVGDGRSEVAAIDPVASMQAIDTHPARARRSGAQPAQGCDRAPLIRQVAGINTARAMRRYLKLISLSRRS